MVQLTVEDILDWMKYTILGPGLHQVSVAWEDSGKNIYVKYNPIIVLMSSLESHQ